MIPKKGGFMAILVGGSTVMAWLASKFWDQALDIIKTYPWVVLVYLGVTGAASFLTCYWFEAMLKKLIKLLFRNIYRYTNRFKKMLINYYENF